MNKNSFIENSQTYLSNMISTSSFALEDAPTFVKITQPFNLNGTNYQIYAFNKLTGYLPAPQKQDEPVLYTFYVLRPEENYKNQYLTELEKMRSNQEYDQDVIGSYYANFVSSFKPFADLSFSLGKMLEEDFYPEKGYQFAFHLVTPTKDYDIALVYLQINSLDALEAKYPGEAVLPFNTGTSNAQPSQEQNQSNVNDEFSAILIDILKAMYFELGSEDMSASFDCVVHFDDQQRILQFENLLVNGEPKMPSFDLTEKVNMISQHIHKLPAKYKLKSVKYSVSPGGDMKIDPVFVE